MAGERVGEEADAVAKVLRDVERGELTLVVPQRGLDHRRQAAEEVPDARAGLHPHCRDEHKSAPVEPCGRGERRDSDQIWRRRRSAGNGENESITDDCAKTKWVANERRNHVMVAGARRSASGWYSADS
jgi:hypothetical protein